MATPTALVDLAFETMEVRQPCFVWCILMVQDALACAVSWGCFCIAGCPDDACLVHWQPDSLWTSWSQHFFFFQRKVRFSYLKRMAMSVLWWLPCVLCAYRRLLRWLGVSLPQTVRDSHVLGLRWSDGFRSGDGHVTCWIVSSFFFFIWQDARETSWLWKDLQLSPQCLSPESSSLFCCQVVFIENSCIFKQSVQPMKESFVRVCFFNCFVICVGNASAELALRLVIGWPMRGAGMKIAQTLCEIGSVSGAPPPIFWVRVITSGRWIVLQLVLTTMWPGETGQCLADHVGSTADSKLSFVWDLPWCTWSLKSEISIVWDLQAGTAVHPWTCHIALVDYAIFLLCNYISKQMCVLFCADQSLWMGLGFANLEGLEADRSAAVMTRGVAKKEILWTAVLLLDALKSRISAQSEADKVAASWDDFITADIVGNAVPLCSALKSGICTWSQTRFAHWWDESIAASLSASKPAFTLDCRKYDSVLWVRQLCNASVHGSASNTRLNAIWFCLNALKQESKHLHFIKKCTWSELDHCQLQTQCSRWLHRNYDSVLWIRQCCRFISAWLCIKRSLNFWMHWKWKSEH